MNLNEKIITKLVSYLILIFSLTVIIVYIKSGYKSFGLYFIPMIFVIISLLGIFKNSISTGLNGIIMEKPNKWITENSELIFFILPLSFLALIGFTILYLAIRFPTNVTVIGWITIVIFIIVSLLLIYLQIFGFTISEKRQKQIDDRLDSFSANEAGIAIEKTIFDKTCFVDWNSIDAIIYYNFYVNSDFTEYYEGYKLYLNTIPVYTKYQKQWWLNKLFPKDSKSKIIDIKNDTKNSMEIPKMVQNYLNKKVTINFKNPMKGTLVSSQTYQSKNNITTIDKWKPNNDEHEQIIFNRFNKTIDEIKNNYF